MTNKVVRNLFIVFVTATLAGCGTSNPSHFYTMEPTAQSQENANENIAIVVGPVTIPASVDRPQFVVQLAPNQLGIDEFHRWIAPLDDNIARVVARNIAVLLGSHQVARAPYAKYDPSYRVSIDVQRFEMVPDESTLLEALWTVRKTANGQVHAGHTLARETVKSKDYDALAAALSRALEQLSRDIVVAIRTEEEKKP
jgi:uncharacterized lipoprotein YmbA